MDIPLLTNVHFPNFLEVGSIKSLKAGYGTFLGDFLA